MNWERRKIGILGMGGSGIGAANLTLKLGATVFCYDSNPNATPLDGCHCKYGKNEILEESLDTLIVSPGISLDNALTQTALKRGMNVVGELGFASQFITLPMLAITGTNGKSSTAHYLSQLLVQAGKRTFIGGNFGTPLSDLVFRQNEFDIAVVEVSSYQMEKPGGFAPNVAAALNLTPDHLARHKTMDTYGKMKQRVFENQTPLHFSIFPADDERLKPTGFGRQLKMGSFPGFQLDKTQLTLVGTPKDGTFEIDAPLLLGEHNAENLAAAFLMCVCAGIEPTTLSPSEVKPLAHRLETIETDDGIRWVNDSKATNVEAALAGITGAPGSQIVLLGGQGKNNANYTLLVEPLRAKAKHVICFGSAKREIATALKDLSPLVVETMEDAFAEAARLAIRGDTVLLSPACASFDAYANFKARGIAFQQMVNHRGKE